MSRASAAFASYVSAHTIANARRRPTVDDDSNPSPAAAAMSAATDPTSTFFNSSVTPDGLSTIRTFAIETSGTVRAVKRTVVVVAVLVCVLAGCSDDSNSDAADEAAAAATAVDALNDELDRLREQFGASAVDDYKIATEEFIVDPAGDVATQIGQTFTGAECEVPTSLDIGTTYTCEATADDDARWTFDVEIDGEDSFQITGGEPAG